jgi:murein DD-endopeptidase MepM/ murein hydrolase activator NlpD
VVGGCSADVTRFDFPSFGLTGKGSETGSLPSSSQSANGTRSYDDTPPGAPPRGAGLGDPAGRSASPPYTGDRLAARDTAEPYPAPDRTASRPPDRSRTIARGETIQVQQGDTLYGISKRYGVSISALIEVNGLSSGSAIKPGQQLVLPAAGAAPRTVAEPPPSRAPLPKTTGAVPPPATRPVATAGWESRHTMQPGESLYGIARQHGVTLAELQRVNGISEPTRVRVGTVLNVPGKAEPERTAERSPPPTAKSPPAAAPRVVQGNPGTAVQPRIINPTGEQRTASLGDRSTDATAPSEPAPSVRETKESASTSGRFRWPARGRVIASFGKRPDGTHNDGINIAVPQGTEIHAAEGGRVAYAGNELKGYGNLVLIRHDNGWVSAYAHADQILVKRDDVVKRGQVIGRAGKTGTVDQPQLHFELRQGAKPVDPMPHMER